MVHLPRFVTTAGIFLFYAAAWAQSPCDLTGDGKVDAADVTAAINMAVGLAPCTANIYGAGVCNVVVVQRVINAVSSGTCLTGIHSVALAWTASTTPNVTYKVYRGNTTGGPYTYLASAGTATTYRDMTVQSGLTYYYVVTSLDGNSNESVNSNQATAVVPTP